MPEGFRPEETEARDFASKEVSTLHGISAHSNEEGNFLYTISLNNDPQIGERVTEVPSGEEYEIVGFDHLGKGVDQKMQYKLKFRRVAG